jgi:glucosamine 6-phosphate synthetase-like amidotransferase/phosphosugar isomerase protein
MCGIAGFFTSEDKKVTNLDSFFADISLMSQLRGKDSTGMLFLDGNYDLSYEKKAMQAADFLELAKIKEKINDVDNYYGALVHCRARTTGLTNQETAHPFVETEDTNGAIMFGMVHNGTLKTWDKKDYLSDSQYLAKKLYTDGHKETLETLDGAAALVWVDQRVWKNYMYTNGERPLVYGFLENSNTMILGSEAHMLFAALERNNLKLENKKFYNCAKNVLYELDPSDIRKFNTETIVPKKPIVVVTEITRPYHYRRTIKEEITELLKDTLALENVEPAVKPRVAITAEETKEFLEKTKVNSLEVLAKIVFYDPSSKELTLEVEESDYTSNIVYGDTITMRGIREEYYEYMASKFEFVAVSLVGAVYNSQLKIMPTWIALSHHIEKNSVLKGKGLAALN